MFRITSQFIDKLHVAFLSLLVIMAALAWFCYDAIHWYEATLKRFTSAHSVFQDIQDLSALTRAELNTLDDRLARGGPPGTEVDWETRAENFRDKIVHLREGLSVYADMEPNFDEEQESQALIELAQTVEEFLSASASINRAIDEGKISEARDEWNRLMNSGITENFAGKFDSAIDNQILNIRSTDTNPEAFTRRIADLLPELTLLVVFISLGLALLLSRSLTRSLNALQDGALALSKGDLDHRIPGLKEREFRRLAETLNSMALELSDHRKRLNEATVKLDEVVEERTRALTEINRRLAEMDLTRRRFLADISHEFRTPLTVIKGESEVVLRGGNKSETEYRAAIRRILDQADHASHVVEDLLFIARADAGEPRLEKAPLSVFRMLRSLCKEFEATAQRNDITIEQHIKGPDAVVFGDTRRLRQVFVILMDNALRYSTPGGTIEVYASRRDGEAQISIRDYGIGLNDEDAERAFDRFYRGRPAQQHSKGAGLGLPVAKAIVEAHNGKIRLKGQLGAGATATVILPVTDQFKGTT